MALLVYCALFLNTNTLKAQTCNPYYTYLVGTGTSNKTVYFNSTNYDSTVQHYWTFGDGTTSAIRNPTKTYVNYGTYNVCHRVTRSGICSDTFCTVLYLTPSSPCVANFNYFKDTINSTVYFNNTSTGTNLLYTWTFGDSTSSTLQSPSHAYAHPGTYTVCLTIRGLFDSTCYSTKCSTIVVTNASNQPCIANFSYSKDSLNNVHFINSSSGNNLAYYWTFGNNTTSTAMNPTKTFSPGTYTVCLTVQNLLDSNCYNTKCSTLTITGAGLPCVAKFTYYRDTINNTLYFNNTSTGSNLGYYWNFGDGTYSTAMNPNKTFTVPGNYNVCLTVRNLLDSTCINTKCSTVIVGNGIPCVAKFTYYKDSINNIFHFNSTSTGSNLAYYWNFGDGTTATAMNPTKIFTQLGTYNVCLTVRNLLDSTCINTKCSTIIVSGPKVPCMAKFTYFKDSINQVNNHYYFYATQSTGNNLTYYWNFGDGTTSTLKNPDKTFTAPGNYNVCLTVRNLLDSTCISTKCSTVVIIVGNTICHANFSFVLYNDRMNANQYGCLFNATNSTGNNLLYSWNFGDGWTATTANYFHMFFPGVYNVCLTVRNAFDSTCIDTKCMTITVTGDSSQPCQTDFSYWQDSSMNNSTVYFNNISSKPIASSLTYLWNFGDGTTSNSASPVHTYPHAGNYNVCLTISDSIDSCYYTKCKVVSVGTNPSGCNASFNYYLDSIGVALFNTVNPQPSGTNYSWTFGDGSSSTSPSPAHLYASNGWYLICLTVWRPADSCANTVCDTILVTNAGTGVKTVEGMSISNMYPVPATNELNIELANLFNQPVEVSITDMTGKVLLTKTFTTHVGQNNIKLDIGDLFGGMYMVQISNEQGRISKKMIK